MGPKESPKVSSKVSAKLLPKCFHGVFEVLPKYFQNASKCFFLVPRDLDPQCRPTDSANREKMVGRKTPQYGIGAPELKKGPRNSFK